MKKEKLVYEAPKVLKLDGFDNVALGKCEANGSSDYECSVNGPSAEGYCAGTGNTASIICTPGAAAVDVCNPTGGSNV